MRSAAYDYDAWGNRRSETAANGSVVTTAFDSTFRVYPTSVTVQPDSQLGGATLTTIYTRYGMNATAGGSGLVGQVQSETDANGAVTLYTYDAFGRLTEVRRPGAGFGNPATEKIVYTTDQGLYVQRYLLRDDGNGDASASATYLEERTFYDGLGRVRQVQKEYSSSQWSLVSQRYDGLGRVAAASAPYTSTVSGVTYQAVNWSGLAATQSTSDRLGRVTQVTQADGSTVRTYYQNRQTAMLDELNHQTISESDAFGRLASVKQYDLTLAPGAAPNWGATVYGQASYSYDVADRLKQMTGPDGAVTTIGYDLAGRKTSMSDPDMGAWSYTYDTAGNLQTQTDARGCVITFSYDGLNRVKGKTYSGSSGCSATAVGYTYDSGATGKGRRTGMSDSSGSASWVYDGRGRLVQESKVISGVGGGTFVTQWSYDSADRPLWMKYPGGSASQIGEQVHYAYTTQGLLNTVRSNGSTYYVGKTQYNERGQVMERWLGSTTGVVKQLYAYSVAENFRLLSLKAGTGTTNDNLQNISYTYDDVGNVLTITDAAAYGGSQTQKFTYDALNRLSTACTLNGANCVTADGNYGAYKQRSYVYSNAGNITNFESTGTNLYYQNGAHKHAVTHVGGTTAGYQKYWYDQNGNATRRISGSQDITLTYDAENRLTAMSGGVTASYVYDGDGNRVKETIGGATRVFVGNTYEVDNGTVKKYYYAGAARVAENSGGVLYYLLTDHLGSTALTLDSAGNRLNTNTEVRYYPYGAPRYTAGTTPTTFNFTGQRRDSGSGLLFYQSRWYDPLIGRFLAADTIVPQPQNPQSLNRYSYVLNNAVRYIDPTGHRVCEDADCQQTQPIRPLRRSNPPGVPPNAVPTITPVITTYWTPEYTPQPDAQGNLVGDPNRWADRMRGGPRYNAALQGSIVVEGQIWKYIFETDKFVFRGSPRNGGVPVIGGWLAPPEKLGTTAEGKTILKVTAAVAYKCPHNVRCDSSHRVYDPDYEPAYQRGNKPEYTLYVVTDENVLIVTPLDTGYGLAVNQIDIYRGIGITIPPWRWGSNTNPQAYIVSYP